MRLAMLCGAVVVLYAIHVLFGWQRAIDDTVYFAWIPRAMALHFVWALVGAAVLMAFLRTLWPKLP